MRKKYLSLILVVCHTRLHVEHSTTCTCSGCMAHAFTRGTLHHVHVDDENLSQPKPLCLVCVFADGTRFRCMSDEFNRNVVFGIESYSQPKMFCLVKSVGVRLTSCP